MEYLDNYTIIESKNANPEIVKSIEPLINILNNEWERNASKPITKTSCRVLECRTTFQMIRNYVKEDNWKSVYLCMKRAEIDVSKIRKCFPRNPETRKQTLSAYSKAIKAIITWIESNI